MVRGGPEPGVDVAPLDRGGVGDPADPFRALRTRDVDFHLVHPGEDGVRVGAGVPQQPRQGAVDAEELVQPALDGHPVLAPRRRPPADDRPGLQHQDPAAGGRQPVRGGHPRQP